MRICFVVRSLTWQLPTYTTTHLAYEAHRRGHHVVYTNINDFSYGPDDRVYAQVAWPGPRPFSGTESFLRAAQAAKASPRTECLSHFDAVFLRFNPNVLSERGDPRRLSVLEFGRLLVSHGVRVWNDPVGLTRASSKIYLSTFPPEIRVPTLISRQPLEIKRFLKELGKPAIIKPLTGYGGQDVFFVRNGNDVNLNQIIAAVARNGYVAAQEFLPQVRRGDKRLLLLNGSPIFVGSRAAVFARVSPKGEIRSNMHVGASRKPTEFTETDRAIAEAIRPRLVADGLYFVGADIVGDRLIEVNVFCPGGIQNINDLYGINVGEHVIRDLESRLRVVPGRGHALRESL